MTFLKLAFLTETVVRFGPHCGDPTFRAQMKVNGFGSRLKQFGPLEVECQCVPPFNEMLPSQNKKQ